MTGQTAEALGLSNERVVKAFSPWQASIPASDRFGQQVVVRVVQFIDRSTQACRLIWQWLTDSRSMSKLRYDCFLRLDPRWTVLRKQVLARDGGRCCGCGKPATEVHHIDNYRHGWICDAKWLRATCRSCHQIVTNMERARPAKEAR